MDKQQQLLTAQEVAEKLGVHLYTVYDYLKEGRLRGFRVGRRWRVRAEALDRFIRDEERRAG